MDNASIKALEIRLATGEGHCLYVRPTQIWLAFPSGASTTKVYLKHQLEAPFPPQQLMPDTPEADLTLALFRGMLMREIGSVVDVTADVEEIAKAADLTILAARGPATPFTIAVDRHVIVSVSPAFDPQTNELAGSNVFVQKICMETNGRTLPVRETPAEVLTRIGWKAENAVGRQDGVAMTRPNRIITGPLQ